MVHKDLMWEMARTSASENSQVPAWGGFNALDTDSDREPHHMGTGSDMSI